MKRWLARIGFLVLTVGGGLAVGFVTAPGEWYAGLAKPAFNPPSWLFAPVWSVLYVLIAVAGWRTLNESAAVDRCDCGGRNSGSISFGRRCSFQPTR